MLAGVSCFGALDALDAPKPLYCSLQRIHPAMLGDVSCARASTSARKPLRRQQRPRPAALDHAPCGDWRQVLRRCHPASAHQPLQQRQLYCCFDAPAPVLGGGPALVPSASARRPLRRQRRLLRCFLARASRCQAACPTPGPSASAHQPSYRRCFVLRVATRPPNKPWRRALRSFPQQHLPLLRETALSCYVMRLAPLGGVS